MGNGAQRSLLPVARRRSYMMIPDGQVNTAQLLGNVQPRSAIQ